MSESYILTHDEEDTADQLLDISISQNPMYGKEQLQF